LTALRELKARVLELLKEDEEFRYAVAGLIGLEEVLKRLDRHEAALERIGAELVRLREDMLQGFKRHDEILARHEEQLTKLREDFNSMLEVIKRIQEEQRNLRKGQVRIEERLNSLESAMISGFGELSKFAGLTFEEFVRKFLSAGLRRAGDIPEGVELVRGFVNGEEVNLFLEDPLIVGEATGYADSADDMMKLLRKAELAKAKYSKEPRKILVILTAKSDAAREMRRISEERDVELIIGKIID